MVDSERRRPVAGPVGGDSAALFVAVTVATAIGAVAVVFLRRDTAARADVPAREASAIIS